MAVSLQNLHNNVGYNFVYSFIKSCDMVVNFISIHLDKREEEMMYLYDLNSGGVLLLVSM